MVVSKKHPGVDEAAAEALGWLQRELAWESVLNSLRRAAGIEVPRPASGPRQAAA